MNFLRGENNMQSLSHSRHEDNEDIQSVSRSRDESCVKTLVNDWSRLPSSIVEQVYLNLNKKDQFHMSLVCKNWLKEYESPLLWKNFKYYLPEYLCSCDLCPGLKFPQKFAKFFKHVEIICKRFRSDLINDIFEDFKFFLNFISENSHLQSIKFINLNIFLSNLAVDDYTNLFLDTKAFFAGQSTLESVEFRSTFYPRDVGAEILKEACEHNSRTLKKLILKDFVSDTLEDEGLEFDGWEMYRSIKKLIMNLTSIHADYSQFLEYVLMATLDESEQFDKKLSFLKINCYGSKSLYFQGISLEAWSSLSKMCPNLKVHMTLYSTSHPYSDYSIYIVPHIPINLLYFCIISNQESESVDVGEFLEHLVNCGCNKYLECLTIYWMPLVEDVWTHLIPFLRNAIKLRDLRIFLHHLVTGIEDLFNAWLVKRPPSLQSVHIYSVQGREEDFEYIFKINEEYSPLLQILDLSVTLEAGLPQ